KEGGGVAVEGLQCAGGQHGGQLAAHVEVKVQHEFDLAVLRGVGRSLLHQTGTGVYLGAAAVVQGDIEIDIGGGYLPLLQILGQYAEVGGGEELPPGRTFESQGLSRK